MVAIATFYRFAPLPDYREQALSYRAVAAALGLRGTLLLAEEGLNGTLAGTQTNLQAFLQHLATDKRWADLPVKWSVADSCPFGTLKVKCKREIVTLGVPDLDLGATATPVTPSLWHELLADPTVTVLDTRNAYEVAVGTFVGATHLGLDCFRQFPERAQALNPQTPIAMFCTGGIRCEKAGAYLRSQGFAEVYQLEGGILRYLAETPPAVSRWQGECFVFDDRATVDRQLAPGSYTLGKGMLLPKFP
ncbi:MAG: oxygen-dependent tRNA uridine(34) hydroxylase TrhO [Pseudanabaenaceae cyanobacterium]